MLCLGIRRGWDWEISYLRDTLAVLSAEENSPCDTAGVLALQEKGVGFAVLETEDLAVAADVQHTLIESSQYVSYHVPASIMSSSSQVI